MPRSGGCSRWTYNSWRPREAHEIRVPGAVRWPRKSTIRGLRGRREVYFGEFRKNRFLGRETLARLPRRRATYALNVAQTGAEIRAIDATARHRRQAP